MGLEVLQVIEIAQNRQRNLWKSLEKKGLDLEKLGKIPWRPQAIPRRHSFRDYARSPPRPRNFPTIPVGAK
jgi:hypothetical protein